MGRLALGTAPALEWRRIEVAINAMLDRRDALMRVAQEARMQRLEAERRAAQAERLAVIGRAAAGIAHELGTPLGVVVGRLDRLERKLGAPSPAAARELDALRSEMTHISAIVRSLLAFSRGDVARGSTFSPDELLAGVVERSRNQAVQIGRDLCLEPTQRTAMQPSGPILVSGDAQRFRMLVRNLIENALRFARCEVRLATGVARGSWWLLVEDDGPGVADDVAARIFEPFVSIEPDAQSSGRRGTGLGLALALAITQEMGGRLVLLERGDSCAAARLSGARFWLSLPLTSLAAKAAPSCARDQGPRSSGAHDSDRGSPRQRARRVAEVDTVGGERRCDRQSRGPL